MRNIEGKKERKGEKEDKAWGRLRKEKEGEGEKNEEENIGMT